MSMRVQLPGDLVDVVTHPRKRRMEERIEMRRHCRHRGGDAPGGQQLRSRVINRPHPCTYRARQKLGVLTCGERDIELLVACFK